MIQTPILQGFLLKHHLAVDIDLFADRRNKKHPRFIPLRHDPHAAGQDAFTLPRHTFSLPLLHPPIVLLPKVLRRIIIDRITEIMIHPI
jgi:hypothetical protein